jgi:hypothetical protein
VAYWRPLLAQFHQAEHAALLDSPAAWRGWFFMLAQLPPVDALLEEYRRVEVEEKETRCMLCTCRRTSSMPLSLADELEWGGRPCDAGCRLRVLLCAHASCGHASAFVLGERAFVPNARQADAQTCFFTRGSLEHNPLSFEFYSHDDSCFWQALPNGDEVYNSEAVAFRMDDSDVEYDHSGDCFSDEGEDDPDVFGSPSLAAAHARTYHAHTSDVPQASAPAASSAAAAAPALDGGASEACLRWLHLCRQRGFYQVDAPLPPTWDGPCGFAGAWPSAGGGSARKLLTQLWGGGRYRCVALWVQGGGREAGERPPNPSAPALGNWAELTMAEDGSGVFESCVDGDDGARGGAVHVYTLEPHGSKVMVEIQPGGISLPENAEGIGTRSLALASKQNIATVAHAAAWCHSRALGCGHARLIAPGQVMALHEAASRDSWQHEADLADAPAMLVTREGDFEVYFGTASEQHLYLMRRAEEDEEAEESMAHMDGAMRLGVCATVIEYMEPDAPGPFW